MNIAFIYGGQGSQVEGMGYDLYTEYPFIKKFYDSIEADFPLKDLSFKGDLDTISKTEYTQPIMLAFQIAATKVLHFHGIKPDIVLGLSLGEYSSLYASDVLKENQLLKIIQFRSKQMGTASNRLDSKMLAVFCDDREEIEKICSKYSTSDHYVQVSNINTVGQMVVAGQGSLISKVKKELEDKGLKLRELNISGPFHTSYMDGVSNNLKKYFSSINFNTPKVPIVYNLYGDFNNGEDIRETMSKQVNNPVLFKNCLEKLLAEDIDLILEIGHKNIIKGLIKRIDKKAKVLPINTVQSIKALVKEVESNGEKKSSLGYWGIKRHRKGYSY